MRNTGYSLLLLVAASQTAYAEMTVDAAGEKLVNDFVTNVITLQGRFEQSLIDAEGAVVETSSGTLEIERPLKFRWTYSDPYEQWLVADGLNIWSYDVDLAQVTVKPQAEALINLIPPATHPTEVPPPWPDSSVTTPPARSSNSCPAL